MPVLHHRNSELHLDRGITRALSELPPCSVALDGYVQGPAIDAAEQRYSFDHHAGCVRHATLSTCEMTLDAVRVGLDPSGLALFVNDLDPDTLLATWLLTRPEVAQHPTVQRLVGLAGRLDALGPAVGLRLPSPFRWALAPIFDDLRPLDEDAWGRRALDALTRLDGWFDAGCPLRAAAFRPSEPVKTPPTILADRDSPVRWALAGGGGVGGFAWLYARGYRAGVMCRTLPGGTWEYSVGKASEFVARFDVPRLLAALRTAEQLINPAQPNNTTWGGGSTIGGGPRNRDGSSSRLSPPDVLAVVERALATPFGDP